MLSGFEATACLLTTSLDGLSTDERSVNDAAIGDGASADDFADDATSAADTDASHKTDTHPAPSRCDPLSPFSGPVPVEGLNSGAEDTALRLAANELTAYFSSNRSGKWRLYVATRAGVDEPFSGVGVLPGVSQVNDDDFSPTVSDDGLLLAYEHNAFPVGGRQIFRGMRVSNLVAFSGVGPVSILNTSNDEVSPFLTPDGSALFFARGTVVDGGRRSSILSSLQSGQSGEFGAPSGWDTKLDASSSAGYPVVGLNAFYFASDAAGPPGKWRIYEQRPPKSAPVLLDSLSISTGTIDAPTWISADGCVLYLQSDRNGSRHVYVARRGR